MAFFNKVGDTDNVTDKACSRPVNQVTGSIKVVVDGRVIKLLIKVEIDNTKDMIAV